MSRLLIRGKLYYPIKVGDEGDWYENCTDGPCDDCGRTFEEPHLPGCDIERCPACGGQMISCDCGPIYRVADGYIDKKSLNELIEKQKQEIARENMVVEFDRHAPNGNIYAVLASAQEQLKKHRPDFDFHEITDRVYASDSYDDALAVIGEYVTLLDLSKQEPEM